jgi:toxin ParE1/3/4
MVEIVVSPQARADLLSIVGYLASVTSPATTRNWHDKLWAAIDGLAEFPGRGHPRRNLGKNVRIRIVGPFIVIYEHVRGETTMSVLRVLRGRPKITRNVVRGR